MERAGGGEEKNGDREGRGDDWRERWGHDEREVLRCLGSSDEDWCATWASQDQGLRLQLS